MSTYGRSHNLVHSCLRLCMLQDAFRTSFRDEEVLAALKAEPHLRNDQQINVLLRWASSIKFFKVRHLRLLRRAAKPPAEPRVHHTGAPFRKGQRVTV